MNSATVDCELAGQAVSAGESSSGSVGPLLSQEEHSLIARLRNGDHGAFGDLVNKHQGALIRVAMGHVGDRAAAEEVVQDTWIAVIQGLARFEGRSSLRTWIFGILIHKAKDRGIRDKRHRTFSTFESCDEEQSEVLDPSRFRRSGEWAGHWIVPPQPWDEQTPEKLLASRQAVDAMNQAIDLLPHTLKEVLILRDIEGIEAKEACELLKITETNLYVRLHRARERVRKAVEAHLEGSAGNICYSRWERALPT